MTCFVSNISNLEIERKYLVTSDEFRSLATKAVRITQGYLSTNEMSTIRVRRWDDQAFLTIKSRGKEGSAAHFEWEKQITPADAEALFPLISSGIIDKTRYLVPLTSNRASGLTSNSPQGGLVAEVDVFHGDNEGLIVAEVELPSEDYEFEKPSFFGEEVTVDKRYCNSSLSVHPYKNW